MAKRSAAVFSEPVRRQSGVSAARAYVSVRATPDQREFLSRLGDGSLSIGFDRALAAAVAARASGSSRG